MSEYTRQIIQPMQVSDTNKILNTIRKIYYKFKMPRKNVSILISVKVKIKIEPSEVSTYSRTLASI
jgi:hypothetical protein